jgi:hypothetical protein
VSKLPRSKSCRHRFPALEGVDAVAALLVVDVFQLFDPGESLLGPGAGRVGLAVLRALRQEARVFVPQGRKQL